MQSTTQVSLSNEPEQPKQYVFLHIPKAAGNAVIVGLRNALNPQNVYYGIDRYDYCNAPQRDGMPPQERDCTVLCPEDMNKDADFIAGHIRLSFLRARYPQALYITFLREPVSRLLSQWLYLRTWPWIDANPLGELTEMVRRYRWPLFDLLQDLQNATALDNLCLRMLVASHPKIPPSDFIKPEDDAEILDLALENLKSFDHSDIMENPNIEENFSAWLGKPFERPRVNEMPAMPEAYKCSLEKELDDKTLDLLQQRTRLDLKLWQHLATQRGLDHEKLRVNTVTKTIVRYCRIMEKG